MCVYMRMFSMRAKSVGNEAMTGCRLQETYKVQKRKHVNVLLRRALGPNIIRYVHIAAELFKLKPELGADINQVLGKVETSGLYGLCPSAYAQISSREDH